MKTLKDYPVYLNQWDYKNNGNVDPLKVFARSNKKYFWICEKGHSFQSTPDKRISRGDGCPVCSNHKVISGINDFKTICPKQMLDWDYTKNTIDPAKISTGSTKVAFWKCHKCGHEWKRPIRDAADKTINCPKCSKIDASYKRHLFELKKNGCLCDKELLLDWDYSKNKIMPEDVTKQANIYVFWKCHICGYEWKAKVNNRSNGRGCPCCGNKVLVTGVNDLKTLFPEIAKEWHPTKNGLLKPSDVLPGTRQKVWWLCPNGHEYEATLNHRTNPEGTGCPVCFSGRQTSFREQALYFYIKKMYPNTINRYKPDDFGKFELDIYIPEINFAIEYDGVAWHKENKFDRERRKFLLCKKLGIKLIRIKEKMPDEMGLDLADEILSTDDFETEVGFTNVIHMVLERICFAVSYRLNPIDVNLNRDRFVIRKYASEIKNSFADVYPDKANEWHPSKNNNLKPNMFKPKSNFKAWWVCPVCGKEYESRLISRANGTGCPVCGAKRSIAKRTKKL